MPATVTITGTSGPGLTVSAVNFTDVISFFIDVNTNMIHLFRSGGVNVPPISINAASTVTVTKSGNNWTLTIS